VYKLLLIWGDVTYLGLVVRTLGDLGLSQEGPLSIGGSGDCDEGARKKTVRKIPFPEVQKRGAAYSAL